MTWQRVADRMPSESEQARNDGLFWCWADGWEAAKLLEYWPSMYAFGWEGGGAWKEVTHWQEIASPELPKEGQ